MPPPRPAVARQHAAAGPPGSGCAALQCGTLLAEPGSLTECKLCEGLHLLQTGPQRLLELTQGELVAAGLLLLLLKSGKLLLQCSQPRVECVHGLLCGGLRHLLWQLLPLLLFVKGGTLLLQGCHRSLQGSHCRCARALLLLLLLLLVVLKGPVIWKLPRLLLLLRELLAPGDDGRLTALLPALLPESPAAA